MKANKNLLIILAAAVILISAGVYYLSQVNQGAIVDSDRDFREITTQSSSDETEEIEKDLDETDFEDLDKELPDIETELNSTSEAESQ